VTDELDQQVRKALQRPRRRSRVVPIALIVFAICASACAYLWVDYGDQVRGLLAQPPATSSTVAADGQQPVSRADFETLQRQTADSIHAATANLEAQKADLEKLSGRVADLVAKVDALRNAAATAPASPPIQNSSSAPPVGRSRPAIVAQRKKPQAPKGGPISVGGAPLPPAPLIDR
jgi:cytoskeletal protein RodZ